MAGRGARLFISGLALAAAGCASAPSRFYTLDPVATAGSVPAGHVSVMVGPVAVPAAVDQPQFVVQAAPNRVEVDEFNRWAAPLQDSIARVVANDLTIQLGTPEVATTSLANFSPAYRVTIEVLRFDSIRGQAADDEAVWTVIRMSDGSKQSGRTDAREPVSDDSFGALAAAHSRAFAQVSENIADAIRNTAAAQP